MKDNTPATVPQCSCRAGNPNPTYPYMTDEEVDKAFNGGKLPPYVTDVSNTH